MSLESLSALKSLVQVREQNANIQEEGRERVQQSVQQQGSSEAQRTDQLGLEKLKAEYEVSLLDARVKRLQAQEAREEKGFQITQLAALGGTILSVGSNVMDMFKSGGDKSKNDKDKSVFSSAAAGTLTGGSDLRSFDSGIKALPGENSTTSTIANSKGGATVLRSGVTGDATKGEESVLGISISGGGNGSAGGSVNGVGVANIDSATKQAAMLDRGYLTLDPASETKLKGMGLSFDGGVLKEVKADGSLGQISDKKRAELSAQGFINPSGQIDFAQIIRDKQLGFTEVTGSPLARGASFDEIAKEDPALAQSIFTQNNRDVNQEQAKKILADPKNRNIGTIVSETQKDENGKPKTLKLDGKDENGKPIPLQIDPKDATSLANLSSITGFQKSGETSLSNYFDATGKTKSNADGVMGGAKAITNSLVSIAQDVVPLFDAMLKMKDRLENTREELKAAQEKLAAASKKLKAIEAVLNNAGATQGEVQDTQTTN